MLLPPDEYNSAQALVKCSLSLTFPFRWTSTVVSVFVACARPAIAARVTGTVIDGAVRWIAHETGVADALRPVRVLHADAVRRAGRVLA